MIFWGEMSKYQAIIYWSKEDNAFIAEVPELADCVVDGKNYQEALQMPKLLSKNGLKPLKKLVGKFLNRKADLFSPEKLKSMSENEKPIYVAIPDFSKSEMETIIAQDNIEQLMYVPLFASLYFEDRDFAYKVCVELASHPNINVRGCAIEGFEHIARIDGKLDKNVVMPIIERALLDENEFVKSKADDCKDGIEHFLKWKFNK
jgi:hypothetical protein